MNTLVHTMILAQRLLRALLRQPYYVISAFIQPVVWLVLYGQLFGRVVGLTGSGETSYTTFVTPGVVVMTALFTGSWTGIGQLRDIHSGSLDRFLVSPVSRVALVGGRIVSVAVLTIMQSTILLVIGLLMGAKFNGTVVNLGILFIAAALLSSAIGAASSCLALVLRKDESLIAVNNVVVLPLTFLSTIFIARQAMSKWIRVVSRANPVDWSVDIARQALSFSAYHRSTTYDMCLLGLFSACCLWVVIHALDLYHESL